MNKKISLIVISICVIVLLVLLQNKKTNTAYQEEVRDRTTWALSKHSTNPSDHFFGNPESSTKIIVYSSASCQYCRQIYPKLKGLVGENKGEIALVYRHLPITYNRGTISNEEIVSECIADTEGHLGFFTFIDSLFGLLPPDEQIELISDDIIVKAAELSGFTRTQVNDCLQNADFRSLVAAQHEIGESIGVKTIPHTYFVSSTTVHDVVGNKSYNVLREILNSILPTE